MLRSSAKITSYVLHPLLLNFVLFQIVYILNPYSFRITNQRGLGVLWIMTFVTLVLFPLIAVLMMKGLKMIDSLHMRTKEERIGPLIVTLTCYIWFFVNIVNNATYPEAMAIVSLGGTIALGLAFFINNFSKISLHSVGAGVFVTATVILLLNYSLSQLEFSLDGHTAYKVSSIFVVLFGVLAAGLIGSSRLTLRAHNKNDLYGGFIVGIVAQLVAFKILSG